MTDGQEIYVAKLEAKVEALQELVDKLQSRHAKPWRLSHESPVSDGHNRRDSKVTLEPRWLSQDAKQAPRLWK